MTTRRTFDLWSQAQDFASRLIREDMGQSGNLGGHHRERRHSGIRDDWPSAAELAGLELCPFRLEIRRFNRLRLELLQRLIAAGWTEANLVEVCHARPEGVRALSRQVLGDPVTLRTGEPPGGG